MENIVKFMEQCLSVLVFLIATYLLLFQANMYLETIKINKEALSPSVMYEQLYEAETYSITYTELIATLLYDLEYDVQIDSQLISKYDHLDIHLFTYKIPKTTYIRSYAYDSSGNITRVIYQSVKMI